MRSKALTLLLLFMLLLPGSAQAGSNVTFSVSIGTGIAIGAGFIYWGVSVSSTHYSLNDPNPEGDLSASTAHYNARPLLTNNPSPKLPLIITPSGDSSALSIPVFRW